MVEIREMRHRITIEGNIEPHLKLELDDYINQFHIGDRVWELNPRSSGYYSVAFYPDDVYEASTIMYLFEEATICIEQMETDEDPYTTHSLMDFSA